MSKTCNRCRKIFKDIAKGFFKNKQSKDGYRSICKACSNTAKSRWYRKNQEITYERSQKWRKENPERYRESRRKTDSRPEARARKNIVNKKYKQKNPHKVKACEILKRAVKTGKIVKPTVCEVCREEFKKEQICGHHEDYSKPLLVVWSCGECHTNYHLGKSEVADAIRRKVKYVYNMKRREYALQKI